MLSPLHRRVCAHRSRFDELIDDVWKIIIRPNYKWINVRENNQKHFNQINLQIEFLLYLMRVININDIRFDDFNPSLIHWKFNWKNEILLRQ